MTKANNLVISDAKLIFRNFSGEEGRFNPAGRRNFCVLLDPNIADVMESEGWNIRWFEPRDEDDIRQPYVQVSVNYKNYPPKIVLISAGGKTVLQEDMVHILDWAEIETVDLIVRPYSWEVNDKSGVKAYLKTMYVTIVEDEFESKYGDVPYANAPSLNVMDDVELPFDMD